MKTFLFPYVIVPALILGLITISRAYMEVQAPDSAATKLLSANVLSVIWMLTVPVVMLKRELSLVQGLFCGFLFFLLHRLVIGGVYAMAWANQWKIEGRDELVRYAAQIEKATPDATTMQVFLANSLPPVGFGLVLLFVIWSITWVIGFRGKRPFAGSAAPARAGA